MVQVKVKGLKRFNNFSAKLGPSLDKQIRKSGMGFMRNTQKSAKLRAPRSTGELAKSIKIQKKGKEIVLVVNSPYGYFQEYGFKPHWVHALLPTRNKLGTIGEALNIAGFIKVSKYTPFITPALEMTIARLPERLTKATKQAIRNARGAK